MKNLYKPSQTLQKHSPIQFSSPSNEEDFIFSRKISLPTPLFLSLLPMSCISSTYSFVFFFKTLSSLGFQTRKQSLNE